MSHVIEAFRFLHARVSTLEARLAGEDMPLDGAAWLAPARELGVWVEPVAAFVAAHGPARDVVHADCGEGALVLALTQGGMAARGVEPRGAVALRALESGCDVTIGEVASTWRTCAEGSLGGLVLSGVVDRLPLYALMPLLAQSRRALAHGAPGSCRGPAVRGPSRTPRGEPNGRSHRRATHRRDLLDARSLHGQTWGLLLERSGFVDIGARRPGRPRRRALRRHGHDAAPVSGVHHFVPVLHRGDAVGRHTLRLRDATRARGLSSNIFVDVVQDDTAEDTLPVLAYGTWPSRATSSCTSSPPPPDGALAGRAPRDTGRELPQHHATRAHGAVGPPPGAGPGPRPERPRGAGAAGPHWPWRTRGTTRPTWPRPASPPPRSSLPRPRASGPVTQPRRRPPRRPSSTKEQSQSTQPTTWLSVGRVSPNKSLEHAITALAVTRLRRDPTATLRIIGKPATDAYDRALRRYVAELGLLDAVTLRGPRQRRHRGRGLRHLRRPGGGVGARGLLRPRRRGDGGRPARGRLRPGRRPRGPR